MDLKIHIFCILTLSRLEYNVVFTFEAELQSYAKVYKTAIDTLELYIKKETIRLKGVKLISERFITEHESITRGNLDDPTSIFKLIKGLTSDVHALEYATNEQTEREYVSMNMSLSYPTQENLNKAAFVLATIQNTYKLNLTKLADGVLNVSFNPDNEKYIQYTTPLNEHDCFAIGVTFAEEEKYHIAVVWLLEAFRRFNKTDGADELGANILNNLVYAYKMLNNIKEASFWLQQLLHAVPEHPQYEKLSSLMKKYHEILKTKKKYSHKTNSVQNVMKIKEIINKCLETTEVLYRKACRGETRIVKEVAKRLKCKYLSENHPFLKLAPVKLEELYLGPDVYLFHNVISDREIEDINSVSKTRFKPCALFKKRKSAEYRLRLCDSTFLEDNIGSKTLIKLYRRVHDFTGMTVNYSEELHVVKYSVGGYYAPHTDFWRKTTSELGYEIQGNRLATVLFYVSVVEKVISNLIKDYVSVVEKLSSPGQGGATVFPHLGLNVYPVKGAALFWKNLYASGEGDLDTVHASCPVIRGSKMIMTQWINSIGQELSLPCNLKKEQGWRENLKLPILDKIMNTSKHVQIKRDMQNCRRYDSRKVFSRY